MLKIAFIGPGNMGAVHVRSLKALKEEGYPIDVTSIADVREERRKFGKEIFPEAKIYEDGDSLLDHETPDLVWITVPSYLHAHFILKALHKGCHVFCEKPLCLTEEEAEEIEKAEKEAGKKTAVGMVVRFMWEYALLKKLNDSQEFGKLKSIVMGRISQNPLWGYENWFNDPKKSGSVVLDLHIHDVDLLRYALGVEPKVEYVVAERYADTKMVNQVISHLRYGDTDAVVEGVWHRAMKFPFITTYRAEFEKRVVYYENIHDSRVYWSDIDGNEGYYTAPEDNKEVKGNTGMNISSLGAYYLEDKYFLDCIIHNKENEIAPFKEGIASVRVCLKELEKAKEN